MRIDEVTSSILGYIPHSEQIGAGPEINTFQKLLPLPISANSLANELYSLGSLSHTDLGV